MHINQPYDRTNKASQICPEEMAKVHPESSGELPETSSSAAYVTTEEESFTIWMRSLVFNSRGCTVFDSKGNIIYRVDNYDCKSCTEVYLMDLSGKVLFTLRKKKFALFKSWEGYRCSGSTEAIKPEFRMRKNLRVPRKRSSSPSCKITGRLSRDQLPCDYQIVSSGSIFRIEDEFGRAIAEVMRKQSSNGLDLGEDVLTMNVKPQIDHSFVMGLVLAHSLIKCIL